MKKITQKWLEYAKGDLEGAAIKLEKEFEAAVYHYAIILVK